MAPASFDQKKKYDAKCLLYLEPLVLQQQYKTLIHHSISNT